MIICETTIKVCTQKGMIRQDPRAGCRDGPSHFFLFGIWAVWSKKAPSGIRKYFKKNRYDKHYIFWHARNLCSGTSDKEENNSFVTSEVQRRELEETAVASGTAAT